MEPIKHTRTARLRSLKMYRPELEQLVEFFEKSCASVVISDNEHRYKSLEEMKSNVGLRIKELDIRGEKPGVHFLMNQKEFPPGSATPTIFNELRTEEITDEAEELFLKVNDFLSHYQRSSNTWYIVLCAFALFAAFLLVGHAVDVAIREGHRAPFPIAVIPCMLFAVLCVIVGVANTRNHLVLETKLNAPSFFIKNREEFAKHAVTAIIGAVIGGIIVFLFGHFSK